MVPYHIPNIGPFPVHPNDNIYIYIYISVFAEGNEFDWSCEKIGVSQSQRGKKYPVRNKTKEEWHVDHISLRNCFSKQAVEEKIDG
jgi:hypothetical protein